MKDKAFGIWGVVQWAKCLPDMNEARVQLPARQQSTQEIGAGGSRVQGHPWLYSAPRLAWVTGPDSKEKEGERERQRQRRRKGGR